MKTVMRFIKLAFVLAFIVSAFNWLSFFPEAQTRKLLHAKFAKPQAESGRVYRLADNGDILFLDAQQVEEWRSYQRRFTLWTYASIATGLIAYRIADDARRAGGWKSSRSARTTIVSP